MGLLEKARELGKYIQECDEYKNMQQAKKNSDCNTPLQNKIEEFNFIKVKLSTAMAAENKNNELLVSLDKEIQELYAEIMEDEHMINFNNAKAQLDSLMNGINQILSGSVNGQDPQTISIGQSKGCGSGGCGSCSGGCR